MLHSWRWGKGRLKSTLMLHQSLSLWSNATSEVGMQSVFFFFLYKHRQTWSVRVFNKTATVPAPPTELHRSTDLLHHIVFWKHRPQSNTAEALWGKKKKRRRNGALYWWWSMSQRRHLSICCLFVRGLVPHRDSQELENTQISLESHTMEKKKKKDTVALMEFSTLTSN